MAHCSTLSRRTLLNRSLYAGLFSGLSAKSYRNTFAAEAPSERVRVGMIGVGNQGGPRNNMQYFLNHIEAMCDLDAKHLVEADAFLKKEANHSATLTSSSRESSESGLSGSVGLCSYGTQGGHDFALSWQCM